MRGASLGTFCQEVSDLGIKHRHYNYIHQAGSLLQRTCSHLADDAVAMYRILQFDQGQNDVVQIPDILMFRQFTPDPRLECPPMRGKADLTFGQKPFRLPSFPLLILFIL